MKFSLVPKLAIFIIASGIVPTSFAQTRNNPIPRPSIEIQQYRIEATLVPDTHEIEAATTIQFVPEDPTDHIVLELNENLWVQKVLDDEGIELEFEDGALGPGILTVLFPRPLETGTNVTIRIEYKGGFDRDPYSRMYSRDESSAYIGMEGSYLMYGAKWIPLTRLMGNRAPTTMEVTVPLGMTVIGPGIQQPVMTKGVSETFTWNADVPIPAVSMAAGQYFQRDLQVGDFNLDCFAKAENLESIQEAAKTVAGILDFYQKIYGPSASGNSYRLVEVDDRLKNRHGMLGTIFITRRELSQPSGSVRDLARRVAYQWWEETVGVRTPADLWLEDGMAYYSAAKYLQNAEGPDAFNEEIEALAILALKFESTSPVRQGLDLGYRTDRYESVVAGKGAWVLNMLHGLLGDSKFDILIQQYIQDYSGKGGSTEEFQKIAESQYGEDLGWFFTEWLDATGVPSLETDYVVYKTVDGFRITGVVKQDRDLFRIPVEVALITGDEEMIKRIELSGKSTPFDMTSFSYPEKIVLDPNHNLLRDSSELRASVQLALGNDRKEQGDFIGAVRAYEDALKINPQRSLAHFRLAEIFYEQFNLQSAADSFRNALNGDMNPKWIEVWCYIYLGKIYDILGQRQRAMAEYQKAINTKDDTNGAQAEANKWIATPFVRKRTIIGE